MTPNLITCRDWPDLDAERFECADSAEYHASPGISNSMLKVFSEDWQLFHGRFVTGEFPHPAPTASMEWGTAMERIVFDLPGKPVEIPEDVLSDKGERRGKPYTEWAKDNASSLLMKADEFAAFAKAIHNLKAHEFASRLLFGEGITHDRIRWRDEETGLLRRVEIDRHTPNILCDLKSTSAASAKEFADQIERLGYHRQAAYYLDAVYALTGDLPAFVFVTVKNKPPYSVECYDLDDSWVDAGRDANRELLVDLARCFETDCWLPPHHGELLRLQRPGWAQYTDQWRLE